uniref:Uncharacterized protein n=1 Tax=Anopheles atroparvus TaxID=41427 RepID=A0A182JD61_ANOAO
MGLHISSTKKKRRSAFYTSDEVYENETALQFLLMASEVGDPEDGWGSQDNADTLGGGFGSSGPGASALATGLSTIAFLVNQKSMKENEPLMKKRKTRQFEIALANAPIDDVHPLLQNKTNKYKQSTSNKNKPRGVRKNRTNNNHLSCETRLQINQIRLNDSQLKKKLNNF